MQVISLTHTCWKLCRGGRSTCNTLNFDSPVKLKFPCMSELFNTYREKHVFSEFVDKLSSSFVDVNSQLTIFVFFDEQCVYRQSKLTVVPEILKYSSKTTRIDCFQRDCTCYSPEPCSFSYTLCSLTSVWSLFTCSNLL